VLAPAGAVFVFNSHLWHSGTRNESPHPRRVVHSSFVRRDQPQQTNQRVSVGPETCARLSEAARYILDI
jgi:ectoine hydroxylase-related dioxygenase (phytanoyl-CoA dioxygenase family)